MPSEEKLSILLEGIDLESRTFDSVIPSDLILDMRALIADHRRMSAAIRDKHHCVNDWCQWSKTGQRRVDCTPENCVWMAVQESSKEKA